MSSGTAASSYSLPARCLYDRSLQTLTIVIDAGPTCIDDIAVAVSSRRVRLTISDDDGDVVWDVTPPTRRDGFGDDRAANYNNGVLTVTLSIE